MLVRCVGGGKSASAPKEVRHSGSCGHSNLVAPLFNALLLDELADNSGLTFARHLSEEGGREAYYGGA